MGSTISTLDEWKNGRTGTQLRTAESANEKQRVQRLVDLLCLFLNQIQDLGHAQLTTARSPSIANRDLPVADWQEICPVRFGMWCR